MQLRTSVAAHVLWCALLVTSNATRVVAQEGEELRPAAPSAGEAAPGSEVAPSEPEAAVGPATAAPEATPTPMTAAPPAPAAAASAGPAEQEHAAHVHTHGMAAHGYGERSPGLAAALSLTPLPVDFGNLYAEDIGWGVGFTAAEVSIMVPAVWLLGGHMGHGSATDDRWTSTERGVAIGLLAGYVAVKIAAALHAASAAEDFNAAHSAWSASPDGGVVHF